MPPMFTELDDPVVFLVDDDGNYLVDSNGNYLTSTVIRYVNTASTPGGDGTTDATTGANRAYATLGEWEAAEQTDLTIAGNTHTVLCSGVTPDGPVTISGWVTDTSNYVTIRANPSNPTGYNPTAIYSAQHYRIEHATVSNTVRVDGVPATQIIGIQAQDTSLSTNGRAIISAANSDKLSVAYCILCKVLEANSTSGIATSDCDNMRIYNNVIHSNGNTASIALAMSNVTTATYICNNTIIGYKTGVFAPTVVRLKNNIFQGQQDAYSGNYHADSDGNSTDSSETTGGANDRQDQTFTFVNPLAFDFRLDATDTGALDHGIDLSLDAGCPVTDDRIEVPRPQGPSFDIGAFERIQGNSSALRGSSLAINISIGIP